MNRTYMQKGIGAAPFAIVAALIIALAAGLWASQPAQAAAGDVLLSVDDVSVGSFVDPGADGKPYGGGNAELDGAGNGAAELEAGYAAADTKNAFRGELVTGTHWAEFQAGIDDSTGAADDKNEAGFMITVSGEGSLAEDTALTTATCTPQKGVCQFPVYGTGSAGDFTVTAAPAAGTALTAGGAGDPATLKGQWVGPATTAVALTADQGEDADGKAVGANILGTLSPAVFLSGATAGLDTAGEVGFLFQLTDAGGRVAMNTDVDNTRDDLRVSVVTDMGEAVSIEPSTLSADDKAKTVAYVDIQQDSNLSGRPGYPKSGNSLGGLVAIGLDTGAGKGAIGRITIGLSGGNTFTHDFAAAGDPDADMSSVGAVDGAANLAPGDEHKRLVTLLDANGTVVPLATDDIPGIMITVAETDADDEDLLFAVAAKAGEPGVYVLTVTANHEEDDDPLSADGKPPIAVGRTDGDTRDASVGSHAFTVTITINDFAAKKVVEFDESADGNPLEAHVGSGVADKGLSVESVTGDQSATELLPPDAGETPAVTVGAGTRLLNITLSASGTDGNPPVTGTTVAAEHTSSNGRFIGTATTDDAGEASIRFVFGGDAASTTLIFGTGAHETVLLVNVGGPGAQVAGTTYSLVSGMGATFVSWQGGNASSSEFENVAGLVVVWKWTGNAWVSYVSDPAVPASLKTDFALSNGDVLFVVSDGAVDITLG